MRLHSQTGKPAGQTDGVAGNSSAALIFARGKK